MKKQNITEISLGCISKHSPFLQTWLSSAVAVQHTSMQTLQSVQSAYSEPVVLVLGKVPANHGTNRCRPEDLASGTCLCHGV